MRKLILLLCFFSGFLAAENMGETMMIKMNFQGDSHTVDKAWLVDGEFGGLEPAVHRDSDLRFVVTDSAEELQKSLRIANPSVLRGVLPEYGGSGGHEQLELSEGGYILRYPYKQGMHFLTVLGASAQLEGSSGSSKPRAVPRQRIDLSGFIVD